MTFDDLRPGMKAYIKGINTGLVVEIILVNSAYRAIYAEKLSGVDSHNDRKYYDSKMIDWDKTEKLNETTTEKIAPITVEDIDEAVQDILSLPDKPDAIKPNHYQLDIKGVRAETRDVMKAVMTEEEYKGFQYGSAIKYVLRAYRKNGVEDLKKAKQFIEWLIEEEEE